MPLWAKIAEKAQEGSRCLAAVTWHWGDVLSRCQHKQVIVSLGHVKVKFGQRETSPLTCCCSPSPLCCIRLFIALCGFAWFEKLCHYISGQCLPLIPFALWLQTRCQRSQSAEGIHALYEAALIQLTSLAGFSGFYPARLQIEYFKAYQAHQWSWRGKGAIFILSASGKETVTHWRRL